MATTSKYIISADTDNQNFIDFELNYRNLTESVSLRGQEIQVLGSAKVDAVFVRPGNVYDLTATGAGADKIYLAGQWGDYSRSFLGTTLTLTRTVNMETETVKVAAGSSSLSDQLIFANGTVSAYLDYIYTKDGGTAPELSDDETSNQPLVPAAPGSPQDATVIGYALDPAGDTFALVRPGLDFTTIGSGGVDTVYVSQGTTVDASALGGSVDLIYFTGRWEDYSKTVQGTKMVFERTVGGHNEKVTVTNGANVASNDTLIFADGAVSCKNAYDHRSAEHLNDIPGYDPGRVTPLPTAPVIDMVAGDDIINAAEATTAVITGTSSAHAGIALTLGTGNVHTATADASGHWSYALQQADLDAMDQGPETISAVATDMAGNMSLAATRAITVDTGVPAQTATITSYTDNVGIVQGDLPSGTSTDDTTPVLNGTLSAPLNTGDTVQIYEGTILLGQATLTDSNHWNYAVGDLVNGSSHNYTARVVDLAGNVGVAANSFSLTVDTTGPTTTNSISLINGTHTMSLGDFQFIEAEDNLSAVRINSTAGGDGELRLNGVRVTAGQTVDAADIIAGKLAWVETTPVTTATKTFNINYDVYDTIGLISPTAATLTLTRAAAAGTLSESGSWFNQTDTTYASNQTWQHVIDAINNGGHIAVVSDNTYEWATATAVATDSTNVEIGLRQNPNALGNAYGWQWYDGTRINAAVTPWLSGEPNGGGGANNGGGENQAEIVNAGLNDLAVNSTYGTRSLTEYEQNEFTYVGFTGADTLDFNGVTNRTVMVNGKGGADTITGGGGNDTISVPDTGFAKVDGKGGFDVLEFNAAGTVNGATLAAKVTNIEEIKLGAGNQQLTLTSAEVNAMTPSSNHTLYVSGTTGDQLGINVGAGASSWHLTGTAYGLNSYVWYDAGNAASTTRLMVDTDLQVVGHDSKLLTTTTINDFTDNVGGVQGELGPMVRYLRIYHTSSSDPLGRLSLTGLKVYADGVDVAADKRSTTGADSGFVNSIYNSAEALTDENVCKPWNNEIQVNSNLAYVDNGNGSRPYIELDLGGLYAVDSLRLWGRLDVPDQSNNLRVYAGANAFGSATYSSLEANTEVKHYDLGTVVGINPLIGASILGMSNTVTDDPTPTLNGILSQAIGSTDVVRIYDNGTYLGNATVNGTTWTYTPATPLTDASNHSYTARVADAAGNTGSVSNALTFQMMNAERLVNGPIEGSGAGWGLDMAGSTLKYENGHFNFNGGSDSSEGKAYQTLTNLIVGQSYTVRYQTQYSGGTGFQTMVSYVRDGSDWTPIPNTDCLGYDNYTQNSPGLANRSYTFRATSSTATVVFRNANAGGSGNDIYLNKASVMLSTEAAYTTFTPLVLDLNGDGVHTTDAAHGVLFDVGNTGMIGRTAWADAADGLLVRDVKGASEVYGQNNLINYNLVSSTGSCSLGFSI